MNSHDFSAMRKHMIDSQLRTNGVSNTAILAAMGGLPRERFVPADRSALAYLDRAIPLVAGRVLNPPVSAALLLDAADIQRSDNVLLVGAGSGYLATALSSLVARVVAIEESPLLLAMAQTNLASTGAINVELHEAPLADGWDQAGPYDVIIIDGAIEELPDAIIAQLKDGGRLVTGQKRGPITGLASGIKRANSLALRSFIDSEIAPLASFAKKPEFVF
jgi:protein-L-isoaspartate(D-aspartate) O-methyltransferase